MIRDSGSTLKFYRHVSENVSKSWTTDQPFCVKYCARWLIFLFTQVPDLI